MIIVKNFLLLLIIIFLFLSSVNKTSASECTYEASITGNHLDFTITSDTDKLAVIQYIRLSGTALVTKMYSPDIGVSWTYFDDPNCNINLPTPIACRQRRSSKLGEGAFWQWYSDGAYHLMPGGVYGIDFDSPPTYDSIGIEYGVLPGTSGISWTLCVHTGEISLPTLTTPPVSKKIVAPGLGAAWNLDAFINCKKETNRENWSLAPYAKDVYLNFLNKSDGAEWEVEPFYYDWRQDIRLNAELLKDFIDSNTVENEKINFVGHSMGGLLGRVYMESNEGGKFAKYISAGTPHQGSVLAYPPWSGGDIWNTNLAEKIGIDLFLKHCGGIFSNNKNTIRSQFPSIQNLLPTFPYLRNSISGNLKPVESMDSKNNYLPTNFVYTFWGVDVGTLSGTGQKTLNAIKVMNPSKNDIRLGNWVDGVPIGREYVNEGDGTVLTISSHLDGANNQDVEQNHRNLVASDEGSDKILDFLGSPENSSSRTSVTGLLKNTESESEDEKSALVLIGYPGSFKITDEFGKITTSDNGMIALKNPGSGNFQLEFESNPETTIFIIAQYLENGQTSYKEYKYKTAPSDVKIIEFNSKQINQKPIKEVKEYKNPHFPMRWHGFWNWWWKWWWWKK